MKFVKKVKQLIRRRQPLHHHTEDDCSECEQRQDKSLHELATRLHVLEWEAYGPEAAKRRPKKP